MSAAKAERLRTNGQELKARFGFVWPIANCYLLIAGMNAA
jgi:hypothetical protein